MSATGPLEYFVFDAKSNQYVPSPQSMMEGGTAAVPILMAKHRYVPLNRLVDQEQKPAFQVQPQRFLLSSKQQTRQDPYQESLVKWSSIPRDPQANFKGEKPSLGARASPEKEHLAQFLSNTNPASLTYSKLTDRFVVDVADLKVDSSGNIVSKQLRNQNSQTSLGGNLEDKDPLMKSSRLLGKSKFGGIRPTFGLAPIENVDEISQSDRAPSRLTSFRKLPEEHQLAESVIDEGKLNYMKQIVDQMYGKDLDVEKEYPHINNTDIFKDILLENEKRKARQELMVQKRRHLNVMKKMADELEKDLDHEVKGLEQATDEIEKLLKVTEIDAKKRELEILKYDIDEQIKMDEEQARKLQVLEAENQLSQLLKDNQAAIEEAEKDLQTGMQPRNYQKQASRLITPRVEGSKVYETTAPKPSFLKDKNTKPKTNNVSNKKPKTTLENKNPTKTNTKQPQKGATKKLGTTMNTVKKPTQSNISKIEEETINDKASIPQVSATQNDFALNTLTESVKIDPPKREKNFFDDD